MRTDSYTLLKKYFHKKIIFIKYFQSTFPQPTREKKHLFCVQILRYTSQTTFVPILGFCDISFDTTMSYWTTAILGSTNKFFMPWLVPRNYKGSVYAPNFLGKLFGAGRKRRDLAEGELDALKGNFRKIFD